MTYRSRRTRYYRRSRDYGHERALQHIREAEELSRDLGGTDVDVKEYFFSLSSNELRPILNEYEREHGREARQYAEETIPKWRNGRRKMAGQTMARLFQLLPRFMPLQRKYSLLEELWHRRGPKSEFSITFGANVEPASVVHVLAQHLEQIVAPHTVPEPLQRRFRWLSDGDSICYQELLNFFLMQDRDFAAKAVGAQVEIILQHVRAAPEAIQAYQREVKVGGHVVHVVLNPRIETIAIRPGKPSFSSEGDPDYAWVWWLVIIGAFVLLIVWANQ